MPATTGFRRRRSGHLLVGDVGNDVLDGGTGNDQVAGGDGDDTLTGGAGNDQLKGEHGDDDIDGGAGTDNLWGMDGNDDLIGGERPRLAGRRHGIEHPGRKGRQQVDAAVRASVGV